MKEYQCSDCSKCIIGFQKYKNHTCDSQESLNNIINGVEKLNNFESGGVVFDTVKKPSNQTENLWR